MCQNQGILALGRLAKSGAPPPINSKIWPPPPPRKKSLHPTVIFLNGPLVWSDLFSQMRGLGMDLEVLYNMEDLLMSPCEWVIIVTQFFNLGVVPLSTREAIYRQGFSA